MTIFPSLQTFKPSTRFLLLVGVTERVKNFQICGISLIITHKFNLNITFNFFKCCDLNEMDLKFTVFDTHISMCFYFIQLELSTFQCLYGPPLSCVLNQPGNSIQLDVWASSLLLLQIAMWFHFRGQSYES